MAAWLLYQYNWRDVNCHTSRNTLHGVWYSIKSVWEAISPWEADSPSIKTHFLNWLKHVRHAVHACIQSNNRSFRDIFMEFLLWRSKKAPLNVDFIGLLLRALTALFSKSCLFKKNPAVFEISRDKSIKKSLLTYYSMGSKLEVVWQKKLLLENSVFRFRSIPM